VAPPQNAMSNTMFSPQTDLRAYHGDPTIKATYLARVRAHRDADDLIQGAYGSPMNSKSGWRGCGVGCTLHSSDHDLYETELGIPVRLAYLQDHLFEALSKSEAKGFPVQFLDAIPVGADLSLVIWQMLAWGIEKLLPLATDHARPSMGWVIGDVLRPLSEGRSVLMEVVRFARNQSFEIAYNSTENPAKEAIGSAAYAAATVLSASDVAYAVPDTMDCATEWKAKLIELLAAAPVPAGEGENR
jgi:hypothetical protein